jgi:formylglycine-generating enzyme required for sulfatase activity
MRMAYVPPGLFLQGCPETEEGGFPWERPPKRVAVDRGYWIGVHEVTWGEWTQVMKGTPEYDAWSRASLQFGIGGFFSGAARDPNRGPVVLVSWSDADAFCRRLSERENATYRLPTEAEWEYACRAKSTTEFFFGDDAGKLGDYAWYSDNSGNKTHPVGQLEPNSWGLYDMHGNVWEWCQDWFGEYPSNPVVDPKGPDKGEYRVLRGGSWYGDARYVRSANRGRYSPGLRDYDIGFRVARDF